MSSARARLKRGSGAPGEAATRLDALAAKLAKSNAERDAALAREAAMAEVLQRINASPGDLAPVFEAILEQAMRLCEATFGELRTYDRGRFHTAATRGVPGAYAQYRSRHTSAGQPGGISARILEGKRVVHILDLKAEEAYRARHANRRALVDLGGARTALLVALGKGAAILGCIMIYRQEVRAFSDKEIALLENFAAQAVLAMENARLINETREALEQQTATAEVLQVINASPGNLGPVFEAILDKAHTLCSATRGALFLFDGETFRAAAVHGYPAELAEQLRRGFTASTEDAAPLLAGAPLIHNPDVRRVDSPVARAVAEQGGVRTNLLLPLRKAGALLGMISCNRGEVRPFIDKEIALLQNFADQAVIAIENGRLLGELRSRTRDLEESLEYHTATSDVLKVISRSTFDLQPVLDTLVETSARLCAADGAGLTIREGEGFRYRAMYAFDDKFFAFLQRHTFAPSRDTMVGRTALEGRVVHIADITADPEYKLTETVTLGGIRTLLGVPMLRDGVVVGTISLTRNQAQPFTERQIELVRTFADQAVIAMENARLLGELRERTGDLEESLEYQTAISDVLKVISRSTFDLQPVLDTVCDTAARLCAADGVGITIREGGIFRYVATTSSLDETFNTVLRGRAIEPGPGTMVGRVAQQGKVVHVEDLAADTEYAWPQAQTVGRVRTVLGVPMLRDGAVVGTLTLTRERVQPFSERQIELVRTFADQAVIAIENTRLLTELRESLEQQQAIAEVLQAINASPGNLEPVFEAILNKATQICDFAFSILWIYDGEAFRAAAMYGVPPRYAEYLAERAIIPPKDTEGAFPQFVDRGKDFFHIDDLAATELHLLTPRARGAVEIAGARTNMLVALRKEGVLLGAIEAYRLEVRPFAEKQIALLQSFAAQAVIAMDNARLLGEIRQRQAELRVTFDNMGDGVAMFDAELRLAAWNRNFEQLLELPEAFLAGRPSFADYLRFLAERGEYGSGDIEAELSRRLERAGEELRVERTRPDGRVIELRRNAVPGGGFVLMYGDVTERKRAEAEIRAARDAAEKALGELRTAQASLVHAEKMASLGQLTAGIAHEIKNPLNFVNNFAGLSIELLDELKEEAAPAFDALDAAARGGIDETFEMLTGNLDKIAEHGRRADGIVKSMLAHSRGSSGERQRVDLNALVEEALNLAYHGARAQDQNFNITMERDLAQPMAPIELVPQDVTRVFLNLIGNAFHAARKRQKDAKEAGFRPVIKIATRDLGDTVEVTVRDNGTGIAPEHRDKLFQPFFTTKPTGEGTGLGLSISWDIVTQQHGGSITVESDVGNFTEFTVQLPRRQHGTTTGRVA